MTMPREGAPVFAGTCGPKIWWAGAGLVACWVLGGPQLRREKVSLFVCVQRILWFLRTCIAGFA